MKKYLTNIPVCRVCGVILTNSNRYLKAHTGRICKSCHNQYGVFWKQKHPERTKEIQEKIFNV